MSKICKRVRHVVLAALFCCCGIVNTAYSAKLDFIDVPSVLPGSEFQLFLKISDLGDDPLRWTSLQFDLLFDSVLLQYVDLAFGADISDSAVPTSSAPEISPGTVRVNLNIGIIDNALLANDMTLASAKFRVLDSAAPTTTEIQWSPFEPVFFAYRTPDGTLFEDEIGFSNLSNGLVTISAVPEPRMVMTMLTGLLLIGLRLWFRATHARMSTIPV